jgi:hypothetical protein
MRRRAHDETGQVMPLLLCGALVVMLGFAAFAIDVGRAYYAKRQLQASADAAALAGAQNLPDPGAAMALAQQYGPAGKNPPKGAENVQMAMSTKCLKSAPGCAPANAIVVKETGKVTTRFARVLGIDSFTVHAQATACSPCGQKPIDVMLVLDRTGSMCTPSCADLNNAKDGIRTFIGEMDPDYDRVGLAVLPPSPSGDKCGVASYTSSSNYVIVPLSDDFIANGRLNTSSKLVSTVNCVKSSGLTAYAAAIDKAQGELASHGRSGAQKVIVFLSDGAANTGSSAPCHDGIAAAQKAKGAGTLIYTIGYDLDGDDNGGRCTMETPSITATYAMQQMASGSGNFYNKPDPGQLHTIYTAIAADILRGTSKLIDDDL